MTLKDLPTFIPLEEAARRYGLSRDVLTRLAETLRSMQACRPCTTWFWHT